MAVSLRSSIAKRRSHLNAALCVNGGYMSLVSDVKSLNEHQVVTFFVLFLSLVAPGMLIVYLFLPDKFESLDTLKLILFSVSLSIPLYSLNIFLTLIGDPKRVMDLHFMGVLVGITSGMVLNFSLLISYFWSFNFREFFIPVVIFEVFYFLICIGNRAAFKLNT
ncbi:hypothetical protein CGJ24_22930 [Vibrio parahaemolyticus]|nr:hypothetical protein CGJ24_22930 [Vibrio parahaemolyticus]